MVSMLGASFLQLASAATRRQEFAIATKQAFYLAEAGLSEAWTGLSIGKTGNVGDEADPAIFGVGLFWVEATVNADGSTTLTSTGMSGAGRATLEVVIEWPDSVAQTQTMFSDEPLIIEEGSLIDGYDSSQGDYPGPPDPANPPATNEVDIQSNGDITLQATAANPSLVVGSLIPGPSNTTIVSSDATITGAVDAAEQPLNMPAVLVPASAQDPGIVHASGVPLLIPSGSTNLEFLEVAAGSEAIIQGPATIVLGELSVGSLGKLTFDTVGGGIDIYITSKLDLQNRSIVETTDYDATQISVRVAGDVPVLLAAGGDFHGQIYAPQARVDIAASFVLFGSAIARRLELAQGVQIHYDDALRAEANDSLIPVFIGWRVVEIPDLIAAVISSSPYANLGVDPTLLRPPVDAHEDLALAIRFDDGFGVQTYVGAESGFDWTLVDTTLNLVRNGKRIQ